MDNEIPPPQGITMYPGLDDYTVSVGDDDTARLLDSAPSIQQARNGIVPPFYEPEQADAPQNREVKIYTRRWYILLVFALFNFALACVWNTWSPIANSAKAVYGWPDGTFSLLANWGPITYVIGAFFCSWLLTNKGLREATLMAGALTAVGAGMRCIPMDPDTPQATWVMHAGQILNALGQPIASGGAPLLSTTWFPAEQRTTATAMISATLGFGCSMSFVIGPLLVSENRTDNSQEQLLSFGPLENHHQNESSLTKGQIHQEIMNLMWYEFGFCALIFLMMVFYFPAAPPTPPSVSAGTERLEFKTGFLSLIKKRTFWMLAVPFALSSGIFNAYTGLLGVNLADRHVSQHTAGWVGFIAGMVGNTFCVLLARMADVMKRHMKLYLISLCIGGAVSFLIFSLAYDHFLNIPFQKGLIYTTQTLGAMFYLGGIPLYYEYCCENMYPIAEGITNSLLTWISNAAGLILLMMPLIPGLGTAWMTWSMVGSVVICVPLLAAVKEHYSRLDLDMPTAPESPES